MSFLNNKMKNNKIVLSKSPRILKALKDLKLKSIFDIVNHIPYKYENNLPTDENNINHKDKIVFIGKIEGNIQFNKFRRISITKFNFVSNSNKLYRIEAFNRDYLVKTLNNETEYIIHGIYDSNKKIINLVNIKKYNKEEFETLIPLYSLANKIEQFEYRRIVKKAFDNIDKMLCIIPFSLMNKYKLLDKKDALYRLHFPNNLNDVRLAMRTLKYEECLKFTLKSLLIREYNSKFNKTEIDKIDYENIELFITKLPYKLTTSQQEAFNEIFFDMNKNKSMYRLLQGDVSSGKTLVAILAMYMNKLRNKQSAFLAPTDALARQHYSNVMETLKNENINVALLLGSTTKKERNIIKTKLLNNEIDIIIGTHALFSDDIIYHDLGLCIIDEQHKFGVNQRKSLFDKGENADLLLLTATPIPRTLALSIYGDLDVSTLTEFPFKERKITTSISKSDDKKIDKLIENSLLNNKRIYIVAPMIFDNDNESQISVEELVEQYQNKYPNKVTYLHGKLSNEDKINALIAFKSGETPIIISTSVIEVGIDVKEADLMIIYGSIHFGLASLHQLRGRIGRDGSSSNCVLILDEDDEDSISKLNVLVESNDGFKISEEDLKRRGPGELSGFKQSGLLEFTYVNIVNDFKMFEAAREDAKKIISLRTKYPYDVLIRIIEKEINDISFTNV